MPGEHISRSSPRARRFNRLSARTVETAKHGRYCDGAGLWLDVSKTGAKKWVFRYSFSRKVRETGLGSARLVTLAEASGPIQSD